MGDEMTPAANLDEFNEQARSFVTKAKAKGLSNTAIANTINFMYTMHLNEQKNKITPYQQAQLDLERERINMEKQQTQGADWELADVNGDDVMEWVNTSSQEVKGTEFGTPGSAAYNLAMQGNEPAADGTGALTGSTAAGLQPPQTISPTSQEAFLQPGQQGPMTQVQTEGVKMSEAEKLKEDEKKRRIEELRVQMPGSSLPRLLTPVFEQRENVVKTQEELAKQEEIERKRLESLRSGSNMFFDRIGPNMIIPAIPNRRM